MKVRGLVRTVTVLLLSTQAAAAVAAQHPQDQSVPNVRARADSLFSAGEYAAAREAYDTVVAAWPDSMRLLYRLAQTRAVTGQPERSFGLFRKAIHGDYRITSALYYMAIAHGELGDMAAAYATLDTMMAAGFRNKYGLLTDSMLVTLRSDERWPAFISEVWGTAKMPEVSQPLLFVEQRDGVEISMRDGTKLAATLMMPEGEGPFPAILVRTPYGRVFEWGNRVHWAARGYVLVVQDVRGRGDSEGDFDPWMNERSDGFDTIDWITRQPWSNGRVGMIGASYAAQVQWLAAAERHPALDAIIPLVSGTDPFYDTPWDHGIPKLGLLGWVFNVTYPDSTAARGSWSEVAVSPTADADQILTGKDLSIWNDWVRRDDPADWKPASFVDDVTTSPNDDDLPAVLHVSGWWDVESIATQRNWSRLEDAGKQDQWLIYGPWEHNNFYEHPPLSRGGVEFGDGARLDYLAAWTRFFDHWLKDRPVGQDTISRVRAYVVGSNRWVTGEAWPLPQARRHVLYLSSGPGRGERGRLLGQPPGTSSAANFVSDPTELRIREDPSFAENTVYPEGAANLADQLAFVSAPLETDMTVLGPVELELSVTVDNHDCDLYGLLVSVAPDGTARALAQPGKVRCSFHLGRSLRAGESVPVTIPMFPIGYRLPAGTRLGLIVRGDWFPRFAPPDPGTGAPSPVTVSVRTGPATVNELRVWILDDT